MIAEALDDEIRFLGAYPGIVRENEDPEKLGRVRVEVPGVCELTGWALPVGSSHSSGNRQRGSYDVPEKNSTVVVLFQAGDPDRPYFMGGWHGRGELLTPVQSMSAADAAKVKAFETERHLLVLSSRQGNEEVLILDKFNNDEFSIKPSGITIKSSQQVVVNAPVTKIKSASSNQPFVLGTSWLQMMQRLILAIEQHTHPSAVGPTGPPLNVASFTAEKNQLGDQLSQAIFGA